MSRCNGISSNYNHDGSVEQFILDSIEEREIAKKVYSDNFDKKESLWKDSEAYKLILEHIGIPVHQPAGFKLLVKVFKREEKTVSGLYIPSVVQDKDMWNTRVGLVLAMGRSAYDPSRFPDGPYCKVGDYIFYNRHDSSMCKINDHACALLNDDKCSLRIDKEHIKYYVSELQIVGA